MRKFSIKKFFSYRNLKRLYYHRIIFPIYKSKRPISEIALGVSVGVFWGLTPTVGAQMYIVFLQWILHKTFIRFKFDLNLAIAMVWISNFASFIQMFNVIYDNANIGLLQKGKETVRLLFSNLGVSLVLGSIIYAVPGAFISYYLTAKILVPMIERRRLKTAAQQKRFARNQLLQELKHEKEVAFSSKIVEKRRVKTAAQQKKFVRDRIAKDLEEIKDVVK